MMKSKDDFLIEKGLDWENFKLDHEYAAANILLAMTEYADQETAALNEKVDRIIKAANAEKETHEKQIAAFVSEAAQLRSELAQTKQRLADCQRRGITGERI